MKRMKQIASLILTFAFIFAGWLSVMDVASAAESEGYTYTIKIILGGTGDEGASFVDTDSDCLKYSGYKYGDTFSFNPKDKVIITPKKVKDDAGNETTLSKYYVKGMRRSGADESIAESAFKVTKDETFVIAYGVGAVVPYTVRFVDNAGNALLEDATYYGAEGELVSVPSRYIDGYTPNKLNETISALKENQVVTFTYNKNVAGGGDGGVTYNTSEVTSYTTVQGEGNQVTQTVPAGQPQNVGGVTVNRDQNADAANAAQAAGEGEGETADADNGEIQIGEEEVPLAGGDESITIPEPEPPKAGDNTRTQENSIRYLFVLAIFGILVIIIALICTYKLEKERKHKR